MDIGGLQTASKTAGAPARTRTCNPLLRGSQIGVGTKPGWSVFGCDAKTMSGWRSAKPDPKASAYRGRSSHATNCNANGVSIPTAGCRGGAWRLDVRSVVPFGHFGFDQGHL